MVRNSTGKLRAVNDIVVDNVTESGTSGNLDGLDDLADLYRQARPSMVRVAHLLTGSNAVAEEIVQDSFVALYQHRLTVEYPRAYLRQIVVNRCHSHLRRVSSEERGLVRIQATPGMSAQQLPPEIDQMWTELQQLNARQRTALVLRYYQDLPVKEIAVIMRVRPGTVKSLIHRGIANLRKTVQL